MSKNNSTELQTTKNQIESLQRELVAQKANAQYWAESHERLAQQAQARANQTAKLHQEELARAGKLSGELLQACTEEAVKVITELRHSAQLEKVAAERDMLANAFRYLADSATHNA